MSLLFHLNFKRITHYTALLVFGLVFFITMLIIIQIKTSQSVLSNNSHSLYPTYLHTITPHCLSDVSVIWRRPLCTLIPTLLPLHQVQCEPVGRVSVSCDWLARWLPSGYTCPRRTPLAWGRCVVQSWRRGMRTCRIFWAPTREGQNWHVPPHVPRSVAWRMKWLSHLWWVWVLSSVVFS